MVNQKSVLVVKILNNFIQNINILIIFIYFKLIIKIILLDVYIFKFNGDWGLGIGDWGFGDWGLGPIPNPQSPIPNPQSPSP